MSRPFVVTLQLLVACMNIPTKVGAKAWKECFALLVDHGEIFGINEAGSWRAKMLYQRWKKIHGYSQYGLGIGTNPIFWKIAAYQFLRGHQFKLHNKGRSRLARRWPGFNAARFMTEVVLRVRGSGRQIAVINVHFVAPGPKVPDEWRRRMRERSLDKLRERIEYHLSVGRIFVLIGDANIRGELDIRGVTWLHEAGVDKLAIALPFDVHLDEATVEKFDAPTDHEHGISADIELLIGAAA